MRDAAGTIFSCTPFGLQISIAIFSFYDTGSVFLQTRAFDLTRAAFPILTVCDFLPKRIATLIADATLAIDLFGVALTKNPCSEKDQSQKTVNGMKEDHFDIISWSPISVEFIY